jgi:hypothetical protein
MREMVTFNIVIDTDEIAYELGNNLSHDEIQDFVMLLDEEAADWDFTVGLVNKLLRSLNSNFTIVADEQKKDGGITVQIDRQDVSHTRLRDSTGVLEFVND